jgi:peptidoglycan/xylan/chitin deacetylase (PgdA/CDA1 family)
MMVDLGRRRALGRVAGTVIAGWGPRSFGPAEGVATAKRLQLTFDDGPEPVGDALNPILDELARRGRVAAFFNLGQEVKSSRAAAKTIVRKGHVLGNHSWDHLEPRTSDYLKKDIIDQFQRAHDEVKAATGVVMKHWRAPRNEQIHRLTGLLVGSGKLYTLSHCDFHADSKDSQGQTTAAGMLAAIRADIKAQSSRQVFRLLFHVKPTTAKALTAILDGMLTDGHALVDFAQSG